MCEQAKDFSEPRERRAIGGNLRNRRFSPYPPPSLRFQDRSARTRAQFARIKGPVATSQILPELRLRPPDFSYHIVVSRAALHGPSVHKSESVPKSPFSDGYRAPLAALR